MSNYEPIDYGDADATAPYDAPLRSKLTSPNGIAKHAHEDQMNRQIAALGSSDNEGLRRAIVLMVAPHLPEEGWPGGRTPWVRESGTDADFLVEDHYHGTITVLAQTEHKPDDANPQDSRAPVEVITDNPTAVDCDPGYAEELRTNAHVLNGPSFTYDDVIAPLRQWWSKYVRREDAVKKEFHAVAQVAVYVWRRNGMPCAILTDRDTSANRIYQCDQNPADTYRLIDTAFPTHTTAETLTVLANELEHATVTDAERADITRVVDAMWMRGPADIDDHMPPAAQALVSPAARWCGWHIADVDWRESAVQH